MRTSQKFKNELSGLIVLDFAYYFLNYSKLYFNLELLILFYAI